ncbi:NAD(P)/FAD-dependent oxidoreductase [Bernardetia sp.]|uniref:NAD(P)/FAD-dependent oxidoreductase n=1 Tax=Bernardetia sp. TaxID=1937974 RepID=UPI0025BCBA49|nr:NAD(P)/FAD-dependent oxidoreductase [Bernardetia sp.]
MKNKNNFDVIIVGGSYAGLSAAMALGRALRKVLIIDSGLPCNRYTPHSHNFITQDGEKPHKIAEKALDQVLKYDTVTIKKVLATTGKKTKNGFVIETEKGEDFEAKKLIFATGVKDILPKLEGFEECWGNTIIHCPYCHGYEVKNEKTGILANGEIAFHYARLIRNWTKDLTIFTNGKPSFSEEQHTKLVRHNISVIEKEVTSFNHKNGQLEQIIFKDNSMTEIKAIYTSPPFEQHCKIPETLGCELTEQGHLKVNEFCQTNIPNIFACGDATTPFRSVAFAVSAGNIAGAMLNHQLVEKEFEL